MNARIPNFETHGMVPEETSGRVIATNHRDRCNGPVEAPHETPQPTTLRTSRSPASDTRPCVSSNSKDMRAAQELANIFDQYLRLTCEEHMTLVGAAHWLNKPASFFCGPTSKLPRYKSHGLAGLLPAQRDGNATASDLTKEIEALGWFIPAAKFFYINTNFSDERGSVPEAIRRTISLPNLPNGWRNDTRAKFMKAIGLTEVPTCPPAIREACIARERAGKGKQLVPERIARQVTASAFTVRHHRNPTEAALDYLSAPGSLFFFNDPLTGERRPPKPGEVIEADDATINFPVCVPWAHPGEDKCAKRYGVKIGRFQWLVCIDAATRYVTAWTYVMRPRSSYRAEDSLALMRNHTLQHGVPLTWRFEQGVWKSKLVQQTIEAMGGNLHTVWSPHQKPYVEGLFNTLWTKLSVQFPGCDVGRFMGETEEANRILTACRNGHQDPRRHFPMLQDAVTAFNEVIAEKNNTPVNSEVGRWVPAEEWAARDTSRIRRLPAETDWIFAPYTREWTVAGMNVGGKVRIFEDLAVPFDFYATWLPHYKGARVRVHFDPAEPNGRATIVLLENCNGRKAGEVLGTAEQINEIAKYTRLVLGWAEDAEGAGRIARQRTAAAVVRVHRAVEPSAQGFTATEYHDGVQRVSKMEVASDSGSGVSPLSPPADQRSRDCGTSATLAPESEPFDRAKMMRDNAEFERQNEHLFT